MNRITDFVGAPLPFPDAEAEAAKPASIRPALYHALAEIAARGLGWFGRGRGRFRHLPLAAGWTKARDSGRLAGAA